MTTTEPPDEPAPFSAGLLPSPFDDIEWIDLIADQGNDEYSNDGDLYVDVSDDERG